MENARTDAEFIKVCELFLPMRAYRDCEEKITECNEQIYNAAEKHMQANRFDEAKKDFTVIKDYKDAIQKISECEEGCNKELETVYQTTLEELNQSNIKVGDYEILKKKFESLNGYKDSDLKASEMEELAKKDEIYRKLMRGEVLGFGDERIVRGWRNSEELQKMNIKEASKRELIYKIKRAILILVAVGFFPLLITLYCLSQT